jgi:hypothetical protein
MRESQTCFRRFWCQDRVVLGSAATRAYQSGRDSPAFG